MPVKNIDDAHHVVRHCKKRLLIRQAGKIVSVYPEAFHLRLASPGYEKEDYLSAIYYEYFDGSPAQRMKACCEALPLKANAKDGLMRLNVGLIKEQGKKRDRNLRVTHEPEPSCPAYAAVRGVPEKTDDELAGLLASLAIIETLEVVTVLSATA
jgi:hypothetical protein